MLEGRKKTLGNRCFSQRKKRTDKLQDNFFFARASLSLAQVTFVSVQPD